MSGAYKIFSITTITCLVASLAVAAAQKDAPAVHVSVDKTTIHIGDRIRYAVNVKAPKGMEVEFPKFESGRIGVFEIKDSGRTWCILTAYSVGKHTIPPIDIKYREAGAKDWDVVKTGEISVTIESVLPKDGAAKDIKDIKGPISFFEMNWVYAALPVAILTVCVLAFIIYKKIKTKSSVRLPHELALEELKTAKGLLSRSGINVKEYYGRVSDCVRRYIEASFKIRAPEMTTEEFLLSAKDSASLAPGQKDLLREFLRSCDLVKFAKYAPESDEIESIFVNAVKFIEETKDVRV